MGGGGEGGYQPIHGCQELPQLKPHLLHQVQVEVGLVRLHPLTQPHHGAHHARRAVVHPVIAALQVSRGRRLQLLQQKYDW